MLSGVRSMSRLGGIKEEGIGFAVLRELCGESSDVGVYGLAFRVEEVKVRGPEKGLVRREGGLMDFDMRTGSAAWHFEMSTASRTTEIGPTRLDVAAVAKHTGRSRLNQDAFFTWVDLIWKQARSLIRAAS